MRHRRLFILLTLTATTLLTLLAAELLLRVYVASRGWTPNVYAASLQMFQPEPVIGQELAANFELRSGTFTITTSSLGLRGPERSRQKPPGTIRIALLGGSSAFGYLVSDQQTAAHLLEQSLNSGSPPVEVLNAGVPGYNLYQTLYRYRTRIAPLEPDMVVLYLGWNDLPYIVSEEPQATAFRMRESAPGWERVAGRSTLYGFVFYRLLGNRPPLAPPAGQSTEVTSAGAAQFRENLQDLAEAVRASGAELVVCAQAMAAHPDASAEMRRWLAAEPERIDDVVVLGRWLHDELEAFAREQGALFVDAYAEIEPTPENLADYVHLTPRGEQQLAELLARNLRPLLPQRAEPSSPE